MPPLSLLVVLTGAAPKAMEDTLGRMDVWVEAQLPRDVRVSAVEAYDDLQPPDLRGTDGIVLTGSPASMTNPPEWVAGWTHWLRDASRGVPTLAICFAHHWLGKAYGGRVERGATRAMGTIEATLTPAGESDLLLAGVPSRFLVHTSHEDDLVELPRGAEVLASSARGVEIVKFGPLAYGIQGHPELTSASARMLLEIRSKAASSARNAIPLDEFPVHEAPAGARILSNFAGIMRDVAAFGPAHLRAS